jgi:hypothetical protein
VPNVYQMLKLDTNAVILTRDVIWINKIYWEYMGITNKTKYNIQDDRNDEVTIIDLIEDENKNEINTEKDKMEENITKNNQNENTEKQQIPRWQRNLQTFYNPSGRDDDYELSETTFLSMMKGSINKPTIFTEAWNHSDEKK